MINSTGNQAGQERLPGRGDTQVQEKGLMEQTDTTSIQSRGTHLSKDAAAQNREEAAGWRREEKEEGGGRREREGGEEEGEEEREKCEK